MKHDRTIVALWLLAMTAACTHVGTVAARNFERNEQDHHEYRQTRPVNCLVVAGSFVLFDQDGNRWVWSPRYGWMFIFTRQVMAASVG